jgi:Zn-dependent M28 family amino/carboxypeptidase
LNKTAIGWATFAFIGLNLLVSSHAVASPSDGACELRVNDTSAKLVECIQSQALWHHLKAFQWIADQNPGPGGHGNRNSGTSGYKASVDYVAGLMRGAGYRVTIQPYKWADFSVTGVPAFDAAGQTYRISQDWFVARLSGSGILTALAQPTGGAGAAAVRDSNTGCSRSDFAGFVPGHIALLQRGSCAYDTGVANAEAAGAAAVIIYNSKGAPGEAGRGERRDGGAFEAQLVSPANIPVVGVVSYAVGEGLSRRFSAGNAPAVHLDIRTRHRSDIDYNLIADSPLGDPHHVVVVDAHLDSIYGAGMLDNASGSTTILEIALEMARTRTRNQLRYIWFGGEELGLLGSRTYTKTLTTKELRRIVFDIDVDVTATPNFAILVADPAHAHNVKRFPPDVVKDSRVGNRDFAEYFSSVGVESRNANFGNDGTDSNSFSLVGVPNSGILTQQDCCKYPWEVSLWGGFLGNFEGKIPGFNGGCVDRPHRWCDNLSNNDRFVLEFVSRAVAYVTLKLANDASLRH